MPITRETPDVFISYAEEDKNTADAVYRWLQESHILCWMWPNNQQSGVDYPGQITQAIDQSQIFLLIWSNYAACSQQILREITQAGQQNKKILSFRIKEVEPEGSFAFFLSIPHWCNAFLKPLVFYRNELTEAVRSLLGKAMVIESQHNQEMLFPQKSF